MPEFQGGSYNPWGGPEGGCPGDIGVDFVNMFYRNLIYQRVTAISLYMLYGGTNWGWLAAPVVGMYGLPRRAPGASFADQSKPRVTTIRRLYQRIDLWGTSFTRQNYSHFLLGVSEPPLLDERRAPSV